MTRTIAGVLVATVTLGAVILPLAWLTLASFKTRVDALSPQPEIIFSPTTDNYRAAFERRSLARPVANSVFVASASSLAAMVLAGPLGYLISRRRLRYSYHVFFGLLTTRMAPPVAVALPIYWLLGTIELLDTFTGLVTVHVAANFAVALWLMRIVFDTQPRSASEAGTIDGLTTLGALRSIVLPPAAPSLVAVFLALFALSWGEMLLASLIGSFDRRPISVAVLELVTPHGTFWGEVAALGTVSLIPVVLLALLATRLGSSRDR